MGISVAVGALLVLALLPAAGSAVRLERQSELVTSDTSCAAGENPVLPGYDPVTHEIYVPNEGTGGAPSILVYNETCHVVGSVTPSLPSDSRPWQAAFNPTNNRMYVTDYGLSEVYVISGTKIVHAITGFDHPLGITYDAGFDEMMVVNSGNDQVYGVLGTGNAGVVFFTGSDPDEIVYDYLCSCDMVTNTGSDNVTGFNTVSLAHFSVPVGSSPEGMAYDPVFGNVYVADTSSDDVSVIAAVFSSGAVVDTISGFDQPAGVAWDQATLHIYVTNVGNGRVYLVNSDDSIVKTESTASDSGASGLVYDDYIDKMYVTGYDNDEVYVLS